MLKPAAACVSLMSPNDGTYCAMTCAGCLEDAPIPCLKTTR